MANSPDEFDDFPEEKSKSQIKREMEALQSLGQRLTELNSEQLNQVPMDDTLDDAIREFQRLKKNEAKRRQMQYIGRVMRSIDEQHIDAISHAINRFDASQAEHTRLFHQIECWRDRLLTEKTALTDYLCEHPEADAQHLRQLIRSAQKEQGKDKSQGGARKLFRYLRDISEAFG